MTCWLCWSKTTKHAARNPICKNGCQICTAVSEVDEEIKQAVTTLRRLLKKRCDLRTEQNLAHDPMQRLPVEIRNHTFELVLPRWDEWRDTIQVEGVASRLSSVCRSWRDIARSNPFLWSTIRIWLGQGPTSGWIDSVHNQIMRAGTSPLTFHIKIADRSERGLEQSREDLAPVLEAMSRCSDRLQSLSLAFPLDTLHAFQHDNLPWHRLTQLRMQSSSRARKQMNQSLSLLNPTASPERIEVRSVSIQSLRISWNRLTFAKIDLLQLEDLTQLLQHATQMTDCHVLSLTHGPEHFSVPPIIHHKLKMLSFRYNDDLDLATTLLDSLTLPCLQEFHTNDMLVLICLAALVRRSSCPLSSLTLRPEFAGDIFPEFCHPLSGVTDLVVETPIFQDQDNTITKLLLEGYFPDLHRFTLRLELFLSLWKMGTIHLLLDRRRLQPDAPNGGRLPKILVVEQGQALVFDHIWTLSLGKKLKVLGISLREDGFEFL